MPNINRVWLGMLTRNLNDAETDSPIVLTVNLDGTDVFNTTYVDSVQRDQERGQANLYSRNTTQFNSDSITNSSIRIGIRGDDAWRPQHLVVFGEQLTGRRRGVVPMGIETDLQSQLSTDRSEGPLTIPIRHVQLGASNMQIRRLLLLMTTADRTDAETDSPIQLQIAAGGSILVTQQIPDTPQDEQERGQANLYFINAPVPFTRDSVASNGSITLSILGDDAWVPASIFLFGLDTATGRPAHMVPLVAISNWQLGTLSSDSDEGSQSVQLPLATLPVGVPLPARKIA